MPDMTLNHAEALLTRVQPRMLGGRVPLSSTLAWGGASSMRKYVPIVAIEKGAKTSHREGTTKIASRT